MSQETIQIKPRDLNKNVGQLRTKGIVPGIMYGQSLKDSLPIQLNVKDLQTLIDNRMNATTFVLDYEGASHECILRDYQTDSLHTEFLHVDFQYVKEDELIKLPIPVVYEGLEFLSGKKLILEKFIPTLSVKGRIQNLPENFVINVGALERGAKILASQVSLPDNTELLINPETIIATVQ